MQESIEKDKKIMQLKAAMSPGEQTFNYDLGTLNVAGGNPIAVKPSSLDGSAMKPDPPQSGAAWNFAICKSDQPSSLIGSATEFDHHQASSKFANISNCPSTNEDLEDRKRQPLPEEGSVAGPLHGQAPSTLTLEPHFGSASVGGWSHLRMGLRESPMMEYELRLLGRADQWSHLFWNTVRDLQGALSLDPQVRAPLPLKNISIPVGEFQIQTQVELDLVSSIIWLELRKFSREHSLDRGLLVSYAPIIVSGGKIRGEMRVGKREVEDLKKRMADLTLPQMLPVDFTDHLVILQDFPHTKLGEERIQGNDAKGPFPELPQMFALCIDRAVMRRKGSAEVEEGTVLSFPIRHDVL